MKKEIGPEIRPPISIMVRTFWQEYALSAIL